MACRSFDAPHAKRASSVARCHHTLTKRFVDNGRRQRTRTLCVSEHLGVTRRRRRHTHVCGAPDAGTTTTRVETHARALSPNTGCRPHTLSKCARHSTLSPPWLAECRETLHLGRRIRQRIETRYFSVRFTKHALGTHNVGENATVSCVCAKHSHANIERCARRRNADVRSGLSRSLLREQ